MNEARNPYSPPEAAVADPAGHLDDTRGLIANGRRVPIGNSVLWLSETFHLFFGRPWKWLGAMLMLLVTSIAISFVPFSNLSRTILWPVAAGSIACALDVQRQTQTFELRDVFARIAPNFLSLAAVGCVHLLVYVVMFLVLSVMTSSDVAFAMVLGGELGGLPANFGLALALTLVLVLPVTAATFLAAPLIVLHGLRPGQAMMMSFVGCLKNIAPWISFGLLMLVVVVLSMIPLFLGLLVTLPVAMMAFYAMYRDIFIGEQ